MPNVPADLHYTEDHEWVRTEADGIAVVGITDHAQKSLGDIVFVELAEAGRQVDVGEPIGTVESVKAVSEIFSPLAGEVVEINADVAENPEDVNDDPYGMWFLKIKAGGSSGGRSNGRLLDAKAYAELIDPAG